MTAQTTIANTRKDWQALILRLLKIRYPAGQFVEVPDKVHGDCGIEGFSRDGVCFQCYAPEEPLATADRTLKIKSKISADAPKLRKNETKLRAILGQTKLKRWVLVTPRWDDKSILEHAEKVAERIRGHGLSFIDSDFCISVETLDNYSAEYYVVLRAGKNILNLHGQEAAQEECDDWSNSNDVLVDNLNRKARAIYGNNQDKINELRDRFIRHYLTGQNTLDRMRDQHPELYELVAQIRTEREEFLATESLIASDLPPVVLKQTIETYRSRLGEEIPGLSKHTIEQLVFGAISDWLLRCPLDLEASR